MPSSCKQKQCSFSSKTALIYRWVDTRNSDRISKGSVLLIHISHLYLRFVTESVMLLCAGWSRYRLHINVTSKPITHNTVWLQINFKYLPLHYILDNANTNTNTNANTTRRKISTSVFNNTQKSKAISDLHSGQYLLLFHRAENALNQP